MTAPLCGSVSMPPLAMEATRCSTSSGIFAASAAAMNVSDIAASAMLMPPEAEPVMPASTVTLIASLMSGLGIALSASAISDEAGQQRDHAAEAVFGCGIERGQQGSGDRRLAAVGELREHRPPGEHEHGQDAEQQCAFDRPDRRHAGDLGDDRLGRRA